MVIRTTEIDRILILTGKDKKMRGRVFIAVITLFFVVLCFADSKGTSVKLAQTPPKPPSEAPRTYGGAVVEKVIAVQQGYVFRCDIKDFPDVVGKDIPVRINAVAPPEIVEKGALPNKFFQQQARKFLEVELLDPNEMPRIELQNITRGRTFSLIADVTIDGKSLAELLIENGLAKQCSYEEMLKVDSSVKKPGKKTMTLQIKTTAIENVSEFAIGSDVAEAKFVASKSSKVFHRPNCRSAKSISPENLVKFQGYDQAVGTNRRPCKTCRPAK